LTRLGRAGCVEQHRIGGRGSLVAAVCPLWSGVPAGVPLRGLSWCRGAPGIPWERDKAVLWECRVLVGECGAWAPRVEVGAGGWGVGVEGAGRRMPGDRPDDRRASPGARSQRGRSPARSGAHGRRVFGWVAVQGVCSAGAVAVSALISDGTVRGRFFALR